MFSLGHFFQQNKLSLQAQEAEAHVAFLRVIELMRSQKPIDHIEAVQLCGQICSRYANPTICNSAFMRISEAFRSGTNTLQLEILRVVQRNTQHLGKIHNHNEFIRPIFTVMYSNDPVARAITLQLLAAIAVSIPDQYEVHHAVRLALQSKNRNELEAALFACKSLAKVATKFAEEIAADVIALIEKPGLSDDERIATLRIVPYVLCSNFDTDLVKSRIMAVLANDATIHSSRLLETCLQALSDLVNRTVDTASVESHLRLLVFYVYNERPEISFPASKELIRFFTLSGCRSPLTTVVPFLLQLLEADNLRVVAQGVKCAFIFLHDPLSEHRSCCFDERLIRCIIKCGWKLQSAAGSCAFAILCRLVALMNTSTLLTAATTGSVIVHTTEMTPLRGRTELLQEACMALLELLKEIGKHTVDKRDTWMLKFILLGLRSQNRVNFPDWLTGDCLKLLPGFSVPLESFQLMLLSFLMDVSVKSPVVAHDLQVSCLQSYEKISYKSVFYIMALRIRAADASGMEDKSEVHPMFENLSYWDLYRLARTALTDGRHKVSVYIFDYLLDTPELQRLPLSAGWITILRSLARSETVKGALIERGVPLEVALTSVDECLLVQMNSQSKLNEFRKPNRFGLFKKLYLEMRINLQRNLRHLLVTLEEVRVRAMQLKDPNGVNDYALGHLRTCFRGFQENVEEAQRVYKLSFDADGPSLAIVRLNCYIGIAMANTISSLTKQNGSVDSSLPTTALTYFRGTASTFQQLEILSGSPPDSPVKLYAWLKELYKITAFFLAFSMPFPRYFMQQYQQTTLSVSLSPAPGATENELSKTVMMDTKFTLKVDGVLTVDCKKSRPLLREVNLIRVMARIRLVKSLPFSSKITHSSEIAPEMMVHVAMLNGLNYFTHSFVMFLGYPGIYRITVDFEFEDGGSVSWNSSQTTNLQVKVVEHAGAVPKALLPDASSNRE